MDEETILARTSELVGGLCPDGARTVSPDHALLADLGYDSVAIVDLFYAIESEFGIDTTGHVEMFDIVTVRDVASLISKTITDCRLAMSEQGTDRSG